jgi:CNT family concentrative nucleoside transporter
VVNEFVSYANLAPMIAEKTLLPKSIAIASVALCGFANFSSIAIQIGGIGQMAPSRKKDLAELGFRALLCGTMASYVSSALAGILIEFDGAGSETWVAGGIMLAAIGLIIIARKLPGSVAEMPGATTKRPVQNAALDHILPSGLPIYDKHGNPVRVPDALTERSKN